MNKETKTVTSIKGIISKVSFYDGDKKSLSASSMTKEPLQLWYEQNDYPKVEALTDATFGSIMHLGMEKMLHEYFIENEKMDYQMEVRATREIAGASVSGKPDLVVDGVIWDFKSGKNYARKMMLKEGKKHPYVIQLSVYNWLLGGGLAGKILWLMKDSKAIEGEEVFIEDDIELLTLEETEQLILEKIESIKQYDANTMPPECKDLWLRNYKGEVIKQKCKLYCSFRDSCTYYNEPVSKTVNSW